MSKRNTIILSVVIGICLIYFLIRLIVPGVLDSKYNTVAESAPYKASDRALSLYESLDFIADLHCDVLLWDRNILDRHEHGHVDVPRLLESKMAMQAFTMVTKTPKNMNFDRNSDKTDNITLLTLVQGRPYSTISSLKSRALDQTARFFNFAKESEGALRIITSQKDLNKYLLDRQKNTQITAGFLGAEGGHLFEGDLMAIDEMYKEGLRMVGPVHFFDNELGGSAHGMNKRGLTQFGRDAVKKMQDMDIMIDLSHAAPALIDDVLSISTKPLIVSHTGVKGTCDNSRNLSDRHLIEIAKGGGLVGIAMFEQAVCGNDAASTARAIEYTVNLVGADHVALGSDFDGAVKVHFDVTGLPLIVDELMKLGMSNGDIRKVMGENVKTFLAKNLPKE